MSNSSPRSVPVQLTFAPTVLIREARAATADLLSHSGAATLNLVGVIKYIPVVILYRELIGNMVASNFRSS